MKKAISALLFTLLLTACGSSYTVATGDDLKNHPELSGVIDTWQKMVDAGQNDDCQTILDHMRESLKVTTDSCDAILAYFKTTPTIDWDRTSSNVDGGKFKIYQDNGASVTGFILDTHKNVWGADTKFWEK